MARVRQSVDAPIGSDGASQIADPMFELVFISLSSAKPVETV